MTLRNKHFSTDFSFCARNPPGGGSQKIQKRRGWRSACGIRRHAVWGDLKPAVWQKSRSRMNEIIEIHRHSAIAREDSQDLLLIQLSALFTHAPLYLDFPYFLKSVGATVMVALNVKGSRPGYIQFNGAIITLINAISLTHNLKMGRFRLHRFSILNNAKRYLCILHIGLSISAISIKRKWGWYSHPASKNVESRAL